MNRANAFPKMIILLVCRWAGLFAVPCVASAMAQTPQVELDDPQSEASLAAGVGQTIGTGDGRIHIIPTLSAPSVKNGGKLTIQAVVKAPAGVAGVEARIVAEGGSDAEGGGYL